MEAFPHIRSTGMNDKVRSDPEKKKLVLRKTILLRFTFSIEEGHSSLPSLGWASQIDDEHWKKALRSTVASAIVSLLVPGGLLVPQVVVVCVVHASSDSQRRIP